MSEIIRSIEKAQLRTDLPTFGIGDTVRVFVKVVEGSRERLQAFEGTVMAKRNGGIRETFTVRRVSYGIGVERTFPLHSPRVDHIEVIRRGKVRRAKLYYLRSLQGKAAKIKEAKRVYTRSRVQERPKYVWALFWYPEQEEGFSCRMLTGRRPSDISSTDWTQSPFGPSGTACRRSSAA